MSIFKEFRASQVLDSFKCVLVSTILVLMWVLMVVIFELIIIWTMSFWRQRNFWHLKQSYSIYHRAVGCNVIIHRKCCEIDINKKTYQVSLSHRYSGKSNFCSPTTQVEKVTDVVDTFLKFWPVAVALFVIFIRLIILIYHSLF